VLKSLGVGRGSVVLIPAYHCRTMIDPVLRLQGTVALYPLQADLTPNWSWLDARMTVTPRPSVFLLPHFFGFPQPVARIKAWCAEHGVSYVEDCSHALFGEVGGAPLGSFGDCAIASPYKFFASEDGGWALGLDSAAGGGPQSPRLEDELRGMWHSFGKLRASVRRTSPPPHEVQAVESYWNDGILDEEGFSRQYEPTLEGRQALRWSRLVAKLSSVDRIADARRRNYSTWLEAVRNVAGCRPLFPALPDSVVPYMFPLWLDGAERPFAILKRAGVPIFRWDELAVSDCAVSRAARLGLIHLPCHQGIGKAELAWMVEVLRAAVMERAPS
jgi:dTDP-4-amino-4,6-dideoxygalactose transaminase